MTNYAPVTEFSAKWYWGKEHRFMAGKGYLHVTKGKASSPSLGKCHVPHSAVYIGYSLWTHFSVRPLLPGSLP